MEIKAFTNTGAKPSLFSLVQRGGSVCAIEIANGYVLPAKISDVIEIIRFAEEFATVAMPDSVALKPNYYFKGSKILTHESPEGHAVRPEMTISQLTRLRGHVAFDHPSEVAQYLIHDESNETYKINIDGSLSRGKFVEFVKSVCNHDIEDYV